MLELNKKPALTKIITVILIIWFSFYMSGCSVIMAANQPNYKDVNVLSKGVARSKVIAELGAPIMTEERNGRKVDVFSFTQGYGKGNKVLRALFHAVADFWTLFLWEIIGTPAEIIASGRKMKVEVIYDKDERVEEINFLTVQKENPKGKDAEVKTTEKPGTLTKIIEHEEIKNYSQYYRYLHNNILKSIKVEKGHTGNVSVEITISRDGQLHKIEILESSTPDGLLREQVKNSAQTLAPYPVFPDDMKNEPEKVFNLTFELRYQEGNAGIIESNGNK